MCGVAQMAAANVTLQHTATQCNTMHHTTTHCNTMQHTAPRCNTFVTCLALRRWLLREAFNCKDENGDIYLPQEVLFRQKEQFSDGVRALCSATHYNALQRTATHCKTQHTATHYGQKVLFRQK